MKGNGKGRGTDIKPTLKTIAGLTGLAVPTVSRALSGADDISLATRERVRETADRIGYVPNRAGVRLRTGRTNVISLVMSTEHDVMNHTAKLISSVAGGLRGTSYHLNITPYFVDEDPMRPIRYVVETRSADAVILNQIQPDDPRIAYLMDREFPFVTHGRTRWAERHAYFDFDNGAFATVAVDALARRGRRNLVLISPPQDQNYAREMVAGARNAAVRHGMTVSVLPDVTSDSAVDAVERRLIDYLKTKRQTDAILCGSTNSGLAAISASESVGQVIGSTIDIFTKEAISFIRRIRPDVMAMHEDVGAAGDFMARAAMRLVLEPDDPPMQMLDVPDTYTG